MDKLFGQILYSWVCKILVTKYFASKIILYSTTVTSVLVDLRTHKSCSILLRPEKL